ncbi:hypothetical protein P154DRAFT_619604 [Amniculicola lignicola CBS 123094]|uniref:Restriction of telomere capping protein 4 n=1 Tax=Amniculicola lignicola CBS 123094 TaxID=1392246 RepID=A0A6A5WQC1_9PLEO|nr:hypothetical protein P154DRAFT_619604 [Amniculicola lignicola CBS 123094]
MPPLSRDAGKLLRRVGGKPHATAEDHEEEMRFQKRRTVDLTEEEINADPVSSDEEGEREPPPVQVEAQLESQSELELQSQPDDKLRDSPMLVSGKRMADSDDMGISKRPTPAKRKRTELRVPPRGVFKIGQRTKDAEFGREEEKENKVENEHENEDELEELFAVDGAGGGASEVAHMADKEDNIPWEWGNDRKAKKHRLKAPTANIHALPSVQSLVTKPRTYGSSGNRGATSKPPIKRANPPVCSGKQKTPPVEEFEEDSDSDCSLKSLDILNPNPKMELQRKIDASSDDDILKPAYETRKERAEREEREAVVRIEREEMTRKAQEAKARVEALAQNQDPPSSQLSNSASRSKRRKPTTSGRSTPLSSLSSIDARDTLNDLEQYLKEMPADRPEADDQCPVCHSRVSQEAYWDFWKSHPRQTIRNQTLFCRKHKLQEALDTYKSHGYPQIDWAALPKRIERLRGRLIDVLRGDTHSDFRNAHEEKVKAGNVRTINSLYKPRTHLKPTVENLSQIEEDEAQVDEELELHTGYYGARGAQAMTSIITAQLAREIRKRMEVDRVVAGQGMAVFVQRVLVPECARELVREDIGVGEKEAKRIVKASGEVGRCVWEEVEDEAEAEGDGEEFLEELV